MTALASGHGGLVAQMDIRTNSERRGGALIRHTSKSDDLLPFGYTQEDPYDVTPDGRVIVGQARGGPSEAFLADLGPECEADYTDDLRLASDDVIRFFRIWSSRDWGGDFDWDGDIDLLDVTGFLAAYARGCP